MVQFATSGKLVAGALTTIGQLVFGMEIAVNEAAVEDIKGDGCKIGCLDADGSTLSDRTNQ